MITPTDMYLHLWFEGKKPIRLQHTAFFHPDLPQPVLTSRGRQKADPENGSAYAMFEWKRAVPALCILCLSTAKWSRTQGKKASCPPVLSGYPASVLIESIDEKRLWTTAIFGTEADNRTPLLKRFVRIANRDQHRADHAGTVSIRTDLFPASAIEVSWNKVSVTQPQELYTMICCIQQTIFPGPASTYQVRGKGARMRVNRAHPYDDALDPNIVLEKSRPGSGPQIPDESNAGEDKESAAQLLRARSKCLFGAGAYDDAYECARKAADLYAGLDDEQAVGCGLDAMATSRPVARSNWIRDTSSQVAVILSSHRLPRYLIGRFLAELATSQFDYGDRKTAQQLYEDAKAIIYRYRGEFAGSLGMRNVEIEELAIQRRIAHIVGIDKLPEGIARLHDTAQAFADIGSPERVGNTRLSMLCLYVQHSRFREALDYLEEHESAFANGTKWTQVAAVAAKGFLMKTLGNMAQANDPCEQALRLFKEYDLVAPSLFEGRQVDIFRPDRTLGIDHSVVQKFGRIRNRGQRPITLGNLYALRQLIL